MYKIEGKNGNKLGVLDTTDGVVEYYTLRDLILMRDKYRLDIEGLAKLEAQFGAVERLSLYIDKEFIPSLNSEYWGSYSGEFNRISIMVDLDSSNNIVDIFKGAFGKHYTFQIIICKNYCNFNNDYGVVKTNVFIRDGRGHGYVVFGKLNDEPAVDVLGTIYGETISNNIDRIIGMLSSYNSVIKSEKEAILAKYMEAKKGLDTSINSFRGNVGYLVDFCDRFTRSSKDVSISRTIGGRKLNFSTWCGKQLRVSVCDDIYLLIHGGRYNTAVSLCDDGSELYILDSNMRASNQSYYFDEKSYSACCGSGIHIYCGVLQYPDYLYNGKGHLIVMDAVKIPKVLDELSAWLYTYKKDIMDILGTL